MNKTENNLDSAGVGFIILPEDISRDEYLKRCYASCKVSINGGYGHGTYRNVYIPKEILQLIDFPDKPENWGTPVVWVKDGYSNQPIIIATLKELKGGQTGLAEGRWKVTKRNKDNIIDICLDAELADAYINLVTNSSQASRFKIKLSSKNNNSVFDVITDNEINVRATNKISLWSNNLEVNFNKNSKVLGYLKWNIDSGVNLSLFKDGEVQNQVTINDSGFKYSDNLSNSIEAKKDNIIINSKKIDLGTGEEKMVLGDTLVSILGELCDAITLLTVPTPSGPSGTPINSAQFTIIKNKLSTALSALSNTQ